MWKPPINFITLHYAYIIACGIISLIILYPYGNLRAVDAYFFGVSGSTESGLNTVDVKALKVYQQLVIYFVPIITNLGFVNIIVLIVRLHWFEKRFKRLIPGFLNAQNQRRLPPHQPRDKSHDSDDRAQRIMVEELTAGDFEARSSTPKGDGVSNNSIDGKKAEKKASEAPDDAGPLRPRIAFAPDPRRNEAHDDKALYVPGPKAREQGHPFVEVEVEEEGDEKDLVLPESSSNRPHLNDGTVLHRLGRTVSTATSIERVASNMFVLGGARTGESSRGRSKSVNRSEIKLPKLSSQATAGRNSNFYNLSAEDRQLLGGIEYRALKLLLKIVIAYFFGFNLFGSICLAGWIQTAPPKYREYLQSQGQDHIWWAFYSSATMNNNLGFTLTPDSMISFRDATFPMLVMTFLAYAGNTCYPIILRLVIWIMQKLVPKNSALQEPLNFLLDHPRRCYTLLFPSRPTWILFGIFFALNFIDVVLIVCLDLDNPAVNTLPLGPRILASIFQAASSRHTGTSVYNLAEVNPAVQFSLLVMMYIAVFPIAISIRASNTYEERSLGIYFQKDPELNEENSKSYVLSHLRNQLSFDIWYIFLGIFCICIAESDHIMDDKDPAFAVFPIFFEVVSAYGNVGLSLGHPTNLTSLCGHFSVFSKLVICAMMIRGRHRMLPYALDRAIVLPNEHEFAVEYCDDPEKEGVVTTKQGRSPRKNDPLKMKRYHTN